MAKTELVTVEKLENDMLAELGRPLVGAVLNEIKSLGIKLPKARLELSIVYNRYLELNRQFRENEVTRPVANASIRNILIEQAAQALSKASSKSSDFSEDDSEDSEVVRQLNDDLNLVLRMEKSKGTLEKFDKTKGQLQLSLDKADIVVTYAPVLPITKPYLVRENLDKVGIKNTMFEGYTVLDKQLVVGIKNESMLQKIGAYRELKESVNTLVTLGKRASKAPVANGAYAEACFALKSEVLILASQMKSNREAQSILADIEPLRSKNGELDICNKITELAHKFTALVIEQLKAYGEEPSEKTITLGLLKAAQSATGQKNLMPCSDKTYNFMGASWLWIMPIKEMALMQRCAVGGHCAISKWAFAFS